MDNLVWSIFAVVYLGMILGRIPGFALDRTGIALLGAIALMVFERVTASELTAAIDEPTIALLFGLMILSAQFRASGFYSELVLRVGRIRCSPRIFLALVVAMSGILSAILVNDIICLAMAPILIEVCVRRSYKPLPFLLALACASNVGSVATLIGNPQVMLIGQVLHLSFRDYTLLAIVPAIVGLIIVWGVIYVSTAGKWFAETKMTPADAPTFDTWQAGKGLVILVAVVAMFFLVDWPRELVAISAAGLILCSRHIRSREMLGMIDWQLLVLFCGLFIVNYALRTSGNLDVMMTALSGAGLRLNQPVWLFGSAAILSNLVSNVPAVMLLLPSVDSPIGGPLLAMASTLSGNMLIVGSIANIIVVDQADRMGIRISWTDHARIGIPVTILSLAFAAFWLWLRF